MRIYRHLYTNNLDYASIEESYRQALLAAGLSPSMVEEQLDDERTQYLEAITLKVRKEGSDEPAPTFKLPSIDGDMVSLEDFRGKVVVLNLWAGWCTPCLVEMPIFTRLHEEFGGYPLAIIAVNVDPNDPDEWYARVISDYDIEFTILKGNAQIRRDYQTPPVPKTLVLDKSSRIRHVHLGTTGNLYHELRTEITTLLEDE